MSTSAALLREQVQASLGERYEAGFLRKKSPRETLPSAVGEIPRGTLTEITGQASSGRTSLLCSLLAGATSRLEFCALIDAADTFDPANAAAAGVRLSQVLWVRCGGNVEHAIRAADLLVQGGGFGVVAIDLGNTPLKTAQRVPLASWFRLRHAVENTRIALIVMAQGHHTQSCAGLRVAFSPGRALWRGELPGGILDGLSATAQCVRNHQAQDCAFQIAR